jgi:DNA mismatch repair ATPase MutS
MQTRPKPLLVVTADAASIIITTQKNAVHITDVNKVFPLIHQVQPKAIILDYDYLGNETEKILRRIHANPFYSKIKVSCYKSRPHTKTDDLLTALGVHQFIYADTLKRPQTSVASKLLHFVFDGVASTKLAG